jgi:4-amino-4-deoxy-L-arabinose transferase-like glycosyltransferase
MSRPLLLLLVSLAIAPYWTRLGATSIIDANEAFYAETPREMIEAGDYVNPKFNYQARFNKPPLSYWVVAGAYQVLGVSEGVARIPIAFGATILILTSFGLARAVYGERADVIAAIVLATTPRFLLVARRIMVDVWLAMFMGLALLLFTLAESRTKGRAPFLLAMYAAIGLGIMTKGPIALLLPGAAFLAYLLLTRRVGQVRHMMIPTGVLLVSAIVLPWYAAIYQAHGWRYIESFLASENIARYMGELNIPRRGPFFYGPVILGDLFPWSLFLPLSVWPAVSRCWEHLRGRGIASEPGAARSAAAWTPASRGDLEALLFLWIAVIVGFFTLSATKQDLYILPVVPAAAALIGGFLNRVTRPREPAAVPAIWLTGLAAALLAAIGLLVLVLFAGSDARFPLVGAAALGGVSIAAGLALFGLLARGRLAAAVIGLALSVAALQWLAVLYALPGFERYKPVPVLSTVIRERAGPDAAVGYYRLSMPSLVFYLRRPVLEYVDLEQLRQAFTSNREVFFLMTAADYHQVRTELPETHILAAQPIFDVNLRTILKDDRPGEVVLVAKGTGP